MNTQYSIEDCLIIDVPSFTDQRGSISVLDKELPFAVKRVFWLHHILDGMERGAHALLDSSEIIVSVHGSFVVDLDDSDNKKSVLLDNPCRGLIIRPGIWFLTHNYADDGVSLILAEEEYAREKYTYDYEEFKRLRTL